MKSTLKRYGIFAICSFLIAIIIVLQGFIFRKLVSPGCGPDGNPVGGLIYIIPHFGLSLGAIILAAYSTYKFYQGIKLSEGVALRIANIIGLLAGLLVVLISLRTFSIENVAGMVC